MVHAANKDKYSSLNRITIAERASLEEVDRPSPRIPTYLFLSREHDDDVTDIGKNNLRSVQLDPLLSNADHLLLGAMRSTKKRRRTCLQPTWLLSKMSTMV